MTAAERVEEYVEEEGEQQEQQQEAVPQQQGEGESVAEQKEDVTKEEEQCVTVDSVVTVDTVVVQDGKVEECHEEVNIKQTFTPEEPMPYGPDESLQEDGKEDEEECGFCLFMKAGPCGKRFAAWEACVDDAESAGINIVEKCAQKTHYLKDCMEANPEYYGPVLQAEKAIDEQTAMEASKTGGEDNPSNVQSIPA